ncbi:hypothetical protein SDC9_95156 [bioreactor metagenome]|uniref:Uncharacterized protein n=1 Tax=bioreactor metagenome TaxID=1076179 RepID=A0A645A819_9ZZZZ
MVLAEHRKSAVGGRAGGGADALGHLFLHHHCDLLKTLCLQKSGDHRRCDVIGEVGAGQVPQTGELFRDQRGDIQL